MFKALSQRLSSLILPNIGLTSIRNFHLLGNKSHISAITSSSLINQQQNQTKRGHISGPDNSIFGFIPNFRPKRSKWKHLKKKNPFPLVHLNDKKIQESKEWDGMGRYKFQNHSYPNNRTFRDEQRRKVFKKFAKERLFINTIRKADILPRDLIREADEEIHSIPRVSAITRVNRRCTLSGKARGVFHQFRVSRIVFRLEADYNKVSGVQRAYWLHSIDIKP